MRSRTALGQYLPRLRRRPPICSRVELGDWGVLGIRPFKASFTDGAEWNIDWVRCQAIVRTAEIQFMRSSTRS